MYGVKLLIKGDYACFTRPEMKVERVSYDVPTPSAMRGLMDAVYFKPGIRWVIDKIHVLNPIKFANIRRNEVKTKLPINSVYRQMEGGEGDISIYTKENISQRATLMLKDVYYGVEAHFESTGEKDGGNSDKHYAIAARRFKEGQYAKVPVLGCREFPVSSIVFADSIPKSKIKGETDLGFMLYDMEFIAGKQEKSYKEINPIWYRPKMIDGVIDVAACYAETKVGGAK